MATTTANLPLTVELVGLWPEYYQLCPKGAALMGCAIEGIKSQTQDYPGQMQEDGRLLQELYAALLRDFGERVRPVSVSYTSGRGLWLSLRYRLRGSSPTVIVDGLVAPATDYEAVQAAVGAALGA